MKTILLIILTLFSWNLYAQTELQGGIYNDLVLSLDNSPYLVTGDVVLFPDKTLTIEPGVEVIFQDDYYLEIRGHLHAIGSPTDTIKFRTLNDSIALDSLPYMQFDWESEKKGLTFDYPTASLEMMYCSFSNFKKALHIYQLSNTAFEIKHCEFRSNLFGLVNFAGNSGTLIDSCEFIANSVGLNTDNTNIQHGSFRDNYYAICGWYSNNLTKSSFKGNIIGIAGGSKGLVEGCTFQFNDIGVINEWEGIRMTDNTIANNSIGIRFNLSDTTNANMVTRNRICNNTNYNVENTSPTNIALNSNCWCSSDSSEIEDKIYDGYDDITSGLINYDIFNESCSSVLKSVNKINIYTGIAPAKDLTYSIYPIPFDDFLNILLPRSTSQYTIRFMDINGRIIHNSQGHSEGSCRIETGNFEPGTYIIEISDESHQQREILVKQ